MIFENSMIEGAFLKILTYAIKLTFYILFDEIWTNFGGIPSHQPENSAENMKKTIIEFNEVFYRLNFFKKKM